MRVHVHFTYLTLPCSHRHISMCISTADLPMQTQIYTHICEQPIYFLKLVYGYIHCQSAAVKLGFRKLYLLFTFAYRSVWERRAVIQGQKCQGIRTVKLRYLVRDGIMIRFNMELVILYSNEISVYACFAVEI